MRIKFEYLDTNKHSQIRLYKFTMFISYLFIFKVSLNGNVSHSLVFINCGKFVETRIKLFVFLMHNNESVLSIFGNF